MKRILIVGNGQRLVTIVHVGFAETIVGVAGLRVDRDIKLENANCVLVLLRANQPISQIVELIFVEVIGDGERGF